MVMILLIKILILLTEVTREGKRMKNASESKDLKKVE